MKVMIQIVKEEQDNYYDDDPEQDNDSSLLPIDSTPYNGSFIRSFFLVARMLLGMILIICLPLIVIRFSESIDGYIRVIGLFCIAHIVCKIFGWKME
ncbi:hypothetical protein SPD48_07790 [Pseudogracilibacillus sp. SE30717A]|uniref:hypothetical protein n=1 Tax=Pseudogracilibacillus sp. SE30717A TaxID=3098293 RepID=UPI00300DCD01